MTEQSERLTEAQKDLEALARSINPNLPTDLSGQIIHITFSLEHGSIATCYPALKSSGGE